ncbi:MAG: hypothetical protein GX347_05980 [Epulopiscium sp.]|nr:hypothetical protein [Candidatus Epulonipiscium sp.]
MQKYSNQGSVTPMILIVFIVMLILGGVGIFITKSHLKMNTQYIAEEKALQYAEAGFNNYLWHLNDDVNFYSRSESEAMQKSPQSFQDGYYLLKITKPSDLERYVTIRSTGWLKTSPDIKRTVEVKIRKKQFVHHVYVSESEGNNIWWTTGDETHGPYHTNGVLRVQGNPKFFDTVTYAKDYNHRNGKPDYKMGSPQQVGRLEFPKTNSKLKYWAELDDAVYTGRTCIYLMDDRIKIRKNDGIIEERKIPSNKVIYIDGEEKPGDKWGLDTANVFVSGTLSGELTIAAKNNIYIMYADPTEWYEDRGYVDGYYGSEPPHPPRNFDHPNKYDPQSYPYKGGIFYKNTTFGDPNNPSIYDEELGIYVRQAKGPDMLGLVANHNVWISHYGWPKNPNDGGKSYWDYTWEWESRAIVNSRGRVIGYQNGWFKKQQIEYLPKYDENGYAIVDRRGRPIYEYYNTTYDIAPYNITIHAAIFAVQGGFGYENYHYGPKKGDIILWGNLTQYIRRPVGIIQTTGYTKKYAHDRRMFYDYPPHILEPTNVGWEIRDWHEISDSE